RLRRLLGAAADRRDRRERRRRARAPGPSGGDEHERQRRNQPRRPTQTRKRAQDANDRRHGELQKDERSSAGPQAATAGTVPGERRTRPRGDAGVSSGGEKIDRELAARARVARKREPGIVLKTGS